jgi:hypothetical protein
MACALSLMWLSRALESAPQTIGEVDANSRRALAAGVQLLKSAVLLKRNISSI